MKPTPYLFNKVILSTIVVTILTMLGINFGVKSLAQAMPTLTPMLWIPNVIVPAKPSTATTYSGNIINVTVHQDCDFNAFTTDGREDFPATFSTFTVDKKSASSVLLVTVNLSLDSGERLIGQSPDFGGFYFSYGGTESITQQMNDIFSSQMYSAVVNSRATGANPITMQYKLDSDQRFMFANWEMNPKLLGGTPTCSVYTVTEIG